MINLSRYRRNLIHPYKKAKFSLKHTYLVACQYPAANIPLSFFAAGYFTSKQLLPVSGVTVGHTGNTINKLMSSRIDEVTRFV